MSKRSWRWATGLLVALALLLASTVAHAAVELSYFEGVWNAGENPIIEWGAGSQLDSAVYHLWRSSSNLQVTGGTLNTAQAERIATYPAPNACTQFGDDFTHVDNTASNSVAIYYYFLESTNCSSGGSVFYGDNGNEDGPGVAVPNPNSQGAPTPTAPPSATSVPPTATPPAAATATTPPNPTATTPPNATATPRPNATATTAPLPTATTRPGATATTRPGVVPTATTRPGSTGSSGSGNSGPTGSTGSGSGSSAPTGSSNGSTSSGSSGSTSSGSSGPTASTSGSSGSGTSTGSTSTTSSGTTTTSSGLLPTLTPSDGSRSEAREGAESAEGLPETGAGGALAVTDSADNREIALNSSSTDRGGSASSGEMARIAAPTPTMASLLSRNSAQPDLLPPLESAELQSDGVDRMLQLLIGLLLLGLLTLGGYIGYTYLQHE
ncbi:MAG: hypothetical protein H6638_08395 [Ardenticatenales bacterium]|nr:hypothetical protein [Ardenticatenales bacterium]